jgi:hypothetical protein
MSECEYFVEEQGMCNNRGHFQNLLLSGCAFLTYGSVICETDTERVDT